VHNRLSGISTLTLTLTLTIAVGVLLLSACQSTDTIATISDRHNLTTGTVKGDHFNHIVVYHHHSGNGKILHVYIEGDGRPWLGGTRIANDPTPRNPLALKLMVQDPHPSIYLGRPCYFGMATSDNCNFHLWTDGRYSEEVIASMNRALDTVSRQLGADQLVLFGYSGGGTLAALLAARNPQVVGLVTIAGNLDIDLWASTHQYLPLSTSVNPSMLPGAPITAIHLAGGKDRVVPSAILDSYLGQHIGEKWVYPEFDHRCCWEQAWPNILARLRPHLPATSRESLTLE